MWSWSRGGMGGVGHLPEAGGTQQQACVNLDALAFCSSVAEEFAEERRQAQRTRSVER